MTMTYPVWLEPALLGVVAAAFLCGLAVGAYLSLKK